MNLQDEEYKEGETFEHFISMFKINFNEFTNINIKECIEMSIQFEGKEYLLHLKSDLKSNKIENIKLKNKLNDSIFKMIIITIDHYNE